MQITKCYIQNFGKLENYEINFDKNLNTINKENGWGKSTLATFIKAMLFGLNPTKKSDLDENERQKYLSWGKESFGGYIEFVLNNHLYRLERKFGSKANQDSAVLYDLKTNKPCQDFSPNIMEEYFNINCETFERTTYIAQGHISTEINDGIRAKLGNLLQNEQQNNFNSAIEKINNLRRQKKVFKGAGGEIEEVKQKINDTNLKLAQSYEQKASLENLLIKNNQELNEIEQKQNELQALDKQLANLDKQHAQNLEIMHYDELQKNLEQQKQKYNNLVQFFHNQIPTQQMLEQKQAEINAFNTKQIELANINTSQNDELNELQKFFGNKIPTHQQINEMQQALLQCNTNPTQPNLQTINRPAQPQNNFAFYYGIVGLLAILAGVIIGVFANLIVGCAVGGVGLLGTIISIIVATTQKQKIKDQQYKQNLDEQKRNIKEQKFYEQQLQEKENIQKHIYNFVALYMSPSPILSNDLSKIDFNLNRYEYLKKLETLSKEKANSINHELATLKNNLDSFFAIYFEDFNQNYQNMLNTMHFCLNDFSNISKEVENCTNTLQEYIKKTGIDPNKKVTPIELQKSATLNEQKRALQNLINELNRAHGQTMASIQTLSCAAENIEQFETELAQYKEQEQNILHEVKVLDNIKKYLEQANENLTSKYISPMTQRFEYYANLISSQPLNISINSNMEMSIEAQGAKRDKKYLSFGYRDIINLCMRFALVDAIFPDEQPTIILDDPFVNLDEQNTKNAIDLINKISNEKQIIYLSCHKSRINK